MATETGPAPNSLEELRGLLNEQSQTGELLKRLLNGPISLSKAASINSLWTAFEETNAAIVQHVLLSADEEYISSGYFNTLKEKYEARMQEIAKLGLAVTPKPRTRTDGRQNPGEGTSSQEGQTPHRTRDAKDLPDVTDERLRDLLTRMGIAKREITIFMDRIDQHFATTHPTPAVLKAKITGLNRHWEEIAILHQKILRNPSKVGYVAEDTYLLEERFDICHTQLQEMLDDYNDDISRKPNRDAKSYVKEISIQIKILTKILNHLKGISFQPQSQSFYEIKLEEIISLWNIIKRLNLQIWQASESTEECLGYTIDTFTDHGILVEESISWLKENLKKFQGSTHINSVDTETNVKLPIIQIPKFDGNWRIWKDFKDLFKEIIEVRSIGDGSKLRYLKSYLGGEPLNLVKHLPSTSEGYSTAWSILTDRYDNDRAIVNNLFSTMMNATSAKSKGVNDLRRIHDTFKECYLAYNNIKGKSTNQTSTEDFLHFLIWSKLDEETQLQYEQQLDDRTALQPLSTLFTFMESRFAVLSSTQSPRKVKTVLSTETNESSVTCTICKSNKHAVSSCPKFSQMTIIDRQSAVKFNKLCYKCLKPGHRFLNCKGICSQCKGKHHVLLHNDGKRINEASSRNDSEHSPGAASSNVTTMAANVRKSTLLPTAVVLVYSRERNLVPCRVLLDSGSTSNFITTSIMQQLGLEPTISECSITGIGGVETSCNKSVDVRVKSNVNKFCTNLNAIVIDEITGHQPQEQCDLSNVKIPGNIVLADSEFNEPRNIDLLLSATITFSVLKPGQIKIGESLFLQNTRYGWVVAGEAYNTMESATSYCHIGVVPSFKAINDQIERFWAIEHHDYPTNTRTTEEIECENHFINTFSRDESGRYIVRIPFNGKLSMALGESHSIALKRFYQLERKLSKNSDLRVQYVNFMKEYADLGHMTEIRDIPKQHYFIPHHSVIKMDSSTTKLRVVFDASAKTSNGVSVNNLQMVGPTIQRDLFDILLGFRIHKYVLTTDIRKMYRQVEVHPLDRKFQLIVWRDDPKQPVKIYQLNTVTYGTASAPYLATRCLHQLAMNEGDKYPRTARALMDETYVDDILTGENTVKDLQMMKQNLINLLKEGGFELGKFASNCPEVLTDIPEDQREKFLNINDSDVIKTLGMVWNPGNDEFHFFYNNPYCENKNFFTKRDVLSSIARLFDPLGLVGPVVLLGKLFMKQLWKDQLQWDDQINNPEEWSSFIQQLSLINNIKIPRWILIDNPSSIQLHAFSDASQHAYGCCIYVRSLNSRGEVSSKLLCSKSRLAPTSVESIARLELCAALLMVELVHRITKNLNHLRRQIYFYTDSQIVLTWINKPSYTLETFVANRVAKIQRLSQIPQWRWIEGSNNPADIISKGMTAKNLKNSQLWFFGPQFLSSSAETWPPHQYNLLDEVPGTKRVALLSSVTTTQLLPDVSSYQKAKRIIGNVIHFINAIKIKQGYIKTHLPLQEELLEAEICMIRDVQRVSFPTEYNLLKSNKEIPAKSSIKSLTPFFDQTLEVIRVGGRLQNADIPEEAKFQYLLPEKHHFTDILARDCHLRNGHSRSKALQANLRQRFWIINCGKVANKIVRSCITCVRSNPGTMDQLMGALPKERVTVSPAFEVTGIDFCGPIHISARVRGRSPLKSYIAVFVCFTTKAIHLELAEDLSSEKFMEVLKRFIGRRGLCRQIHSDNGTNFVGTNRKLEEIKRLISVESNPLLKGFNSENNIEWVYRETTKWKFIPPRSPHMGGLWEAAVKSTKAILEKLLLNTNLTYPELLTVLCQIEAQLNSRPLTPLSADPNDLEPLTPGHFLIFRPLNALPERNLIEHNILPRDRFGHMQQIQQHFWKRWTKEYLSLLQKRYKWTESRDNVKVGTMVLLHDMNLPPLKWPIGRIVEVHKSPDQLVRRVKVKTAQNTYERTLPYISPLPIEVNDENSTYPEVIEPELERKEDPPKTLKRRGQSEVSLVTALAKKKCNPTLVTGKKLIYSVMIFLLLIPLIIADVNVVPLNEDSGIFIENIGKVGLSKSTWTLVTYFNLTSYWSSFVNIKECVQSLNDLCDEKDFLTDCFNISHQLQIRLDQIHSKNEIILNLNGERLHKRNAPLGFIGSLLHLTAGVMDEEHANKLIDDINAVSQQQQFIIHAMRNLTSFQDTSSNVMIRNQDTVLVEFKQIKTTINCITKMTQAINAMVHFNAASNNIHLKIMDFEKTQDFIIDAITDSRHSVGNSFLITPNQLESHISKIRNFLPVALTLPSAFISEVYKTMEIRTRVTKELIIFEVNIPLVSTEMFNLLRLHPLPSFDGGKAFSIKPEFSFILLNDEKDKYYPISQTDMISCKSIIDKLICHQSHPIFRVEGRSGCEISIIKGDNKLSSQCAVRVAVAEPTFIQLKSANTWVTALPSKEQFNVQCSQHDLKVTLEGHSLLKMDPGCVLYSSTAMLVANKNYKDKIKYVSTELKLTPTIRNLTNIASLKTDTVLENLPQHGIDFSGNMSWNHIHHYAIGYSNLVIIGVVIATIAFVWTKKIQIAQSLLRQINTIEPAAITDGMSSRNSCANLHTPSVNPRPLPRFSV